MPTASIWLLPTHEAGAPIARGIDAFAARWRAPAFAPHLTVRGSLQAPVGEVVRTVRPLAAEAAPIRLRAIGPDADDVYFRALYVQLDDSPALAALRDAIALRFGPPTGATPVPHVSLLYADVSPDHRARLIAEAAPYARADHLLFDRLAIVDHGTDILDVEGWKTAATFFLGTGRTDTDKLRSDP